jgi:predicted TIM-barrel fold metal-dependent hydrolase
VLWNTFKRMTGRLPESARQALFHDNAAAVYRI